MYEYGKFTENIIYKGQRKQPTSLSDNDDVVLDLKDRQYLSSVAETSNHSP
jgi:hypothetical protein